MRCYKCMGLGHTRPQCPSATNRGILCYRCGEEGHLSAYCNADRMLCRVCADAGRPAAHMMGGRNCRPPIIKKSKGTLKPPERSRSPILGVTAMIQ